MGRFDKANNSGNGFTIDDGEVRNCFDSICAEKAQNTTQPTEAAAKTLSEWVQGGMQDPIPETLIKFTMSQAGGTHDSAQESWVRFRNKRNAEAS